MNPRQTISRLPALCAAAAIFALGVPPALAGQAPAEVAARPATGTRLITLGTGGGPVARRTRSQPANLLQVDDRLYLIDVGDGTSRALVENGFRPAQIDRIFITHLHQDHAGGLAPLLGFSLPSNRGTAVDIYGPPGTAAFVGKAIGYLSIPMGVHQAESPWFPPMDRIFLGHDVRADGITVVYQDDKVRVSAIENSHFITIDPARRPVGAQKSYSYRFDTADRSIVFTGDTGPSEHLVELARGADILVSEVQDLDEVLAIVRSFPGTPDQKKAGEAHMREEHLGPEEVARLATSAGVKMVVFTHLSTAENAGMTANDLARRARASFNGAVVLARDGSEF